MKAWVLRGINDLRLEDTPAPIPKNGETLVQVKAAGICSSDIERVYNTGAYHYPIILGHEFSGVTENGRRVGVFPLLPCFRCGSCNSGYYETCSNYGYLGSRQDGAFAEYVAVPEWNLFELPDNVTFEQAALFEPAAVALHAAKKIDISKAASAAVVGTGAIGKLIVRWLEILGMSDVTMIGKNDFPPRRFDACFEAVGSANALNKCIDLTRPNGQLVLVGNPNADFNLGQKQYWQFLRKQLTLCGSWNSEYPADWQTVIKNVQKLQTPQIVSHSYRFIELGKVIKMMYERKISYSKVVITVCA